MNIDLINTIVSAGVGAAVALITLYVDGLRKKKDRKREEYNIYKSYSKPIIAAAESLAWRLREVLMFNGAYLLPDAPMNGFFKYKFDSTVYRLCFLIGWIRAVQKEHSYIEGIRDNQNPKIRKAINSFQKVLADGSHVEVSILEELCKLYGLEEKQISDSIRQKLGVEIERIVFGFIPDQVKKNVTNLQTDQKTEMISSIMNLISEHTEQNIIEKAHIKEKVDIAIDELAREFCWIYRDWQNAIGDEMILKLEDAKRIYDVIGFSEFMKRRSENEWIQKADNLFANLDVSIDNRFDTRVSQVKRIYISLIELITVLSETIEDEEGISKSGLETLTELKIELEQEEK
ncbi:hypothetical protein [Cyclobacterium sp. SYSU L10401]|uniref:hypothetical protein n=1 Tax=Cyclobacterium sp. SYSU L10401 TaxID=2678657 RepID=UPI0013D381A3|nr:hypothetical protein [Cyclobacterium sp. SYSU L10401]